MVARGVPDASLLTPAAVVQTTRMPAVAEPAPTMAVPGLAAPDQGAETALMPSRHDAPSTMIRPRRAG
jgi:hypothetical protein